MATLLCNCSKSNIEFINNAYNDKEMEFIIFSKLDEVINYLDKCNTQVLMIVELVETDKELLLEIKKKGYNIIILSLLNKSQTELSASLINNHLIDYIDWLPINSIKLIDKIMNQVSLFNKHNESTDKHINNWIDVIKKDEIREMVTMEYIYSLIYGDVPRIEAISGITYILNLNKVPNIVFLVMIDEFWDICAKLDNQKRYIMKKNVLKIIKDSIIDYKAIACSLIGTDKIIILLDLPKISKEKLQEDILKMANYIKDYIKKNSEHTITLGVSNIHDNYKEIWRGYEESFQAINYSFSLGQDLVINYKDLNKNDIENSINYDYIYFEYQLYKNLSRNDKELILSFFNIIFNSLISKRYEKDAIISIMNKLVYDVLEYCKKLGIDENLITIIYKETAPKIIRASSINSLKNIGNRFFEHISSSILEFSIDENDISLDGAKVFMDKYYYNDITLKDVAHIAKMSESSFSRKFKMRYGINFVNYVLQVRLEKASELLSLPSLTITEISSRVGFNDISHFSKSFKKIYNVSPSGYRYSKRGKG